MCDLLSCIKWYLNSCWMKWWANIKRNHMVPGSWGILRNGWKSEGIFLHKTKGKHVKNPYIYVYKHDCCNVFQICAVSWSELCWRKKWKWWWRIRQRCLDVFTGIIRIFLVMTGTFASSMTLTRNSSMAAKISPAYWSYRVTWCQSSLAWGESSLRHTTGWTVA